MLKICLATPCYGSVVHLGYMNSVMRLTAEARERGIEISLMAQGGDSLIPRVRNAMVAQFMSEPSHTHLMWIDADISFDPEDFFRLLAADRDVAAGIYPLKRVFWPTEPVAECVTELHTLRYAFNLEEGTSSTVDEAGFFEVLDAATGFMLIRRSVFETMAEHYQNLRYVPDMIDESGTPWHFRFFDVAVEGNGRYLSEDYAFCRRWQQIGGKVYADANSRLSHTGTHTFRGDFAASRALTTRLS